MHIKRQLHRAHLRKLSLISSNEIPHDFHPDSGIPLQTIISYIEPTVSSNVSNDNLSNTLPKQNKRSRFDLKKSFQRSRSAYMTQFHSWFQRHRRQQQHPQRDSSPIRRKSAIETKIPTPCSTPKLLGSPRLARLHQKFFKISAPPPSPQLPLTSSSPLEALDDSDTRSQIELPVRIYFPPLTPPTFRHIRIRETERFISNESQSNVTTPMLERKYTSSSSSPSSIRTATAKERRESFATLSNAFHNRYM